MLEKHFETGSAFTFSECVEIIKEGKIRYEHKIPPGYGDFYKKEKKGMQIFADLIIWKEILRFSKSTSKNIIFITNDTNKDEDWCHSRKQHGAIRITKPRDELIREIHDYSGSELWMYTLYQFIYHSKKYLASKIETKELVSINRSLIDIRGNVNFYYPEDDFFEDYTSCHACEGGRDGEGNLVCLDHTFDIFNNYPPNHELIKYDSARGGTCGYCNTHNFMCPKCNSVNAYLDHEYNEKHECKGGCGLSFYVDAAYDDDLVASTELIILDHRIEKCNRCSNDFIPEAGEETCPKCEDAYIND